MKYILIKNIIYNWFMAIIISKQGDFINLLAYVNAPRTNISQQVEILNEKK